MPFPIAPAIIGGASLLGGLGSALFGGGGKGLDAQTLQRLFGPQALGQETLQLYNFLAQSPQFRQLLLQNAIQGSQFQTQLAGNLAQRGLTTSGIGSIAGAAGTSAIQTGETALRGGLFGTAQESALQNLLARLQAFAGGQQARIGQISPLQQFFGSTLGAVGQALPFFGQGTSR